MEVRRRDHIHKAKAGSGHKFQKAIATYGPEAFEWEQIDTASSNNESAEKESQYVLQYNCIMSGYNSDCGGGIKKNIYQYSIPDGKLIQVYENLESAGDVVGVGKSSISKACLTKLRTCAGYYWSYSLKENFIPGEDKRLKQVYQFTLQGKYLRNYKSVADASKKTAVNQSSIAKCCRGLYKSAGGFYWNN